MMDMIFSCINKWDRTVGKWEKKDTVYDDIELIEIARDRTYDAIVVKFIAKKGRRKR